MISVEKPGSPEEVLEHFGKKGMKWGVHKAVIKSGAFKRLSKASEANVQRYNARQTAKRERKQARDLQKGITAKKVVIGVGVGIVATGAVYTAYKMKQNGNLKLSSVTMGSKKRPMDARITEQIKGLQAALKHPDVSPEGKQEARELIEMLKSIQK